MADIKNPAGLPLLERLIDDYPELTFQPGDAFCWSPVNRHIIYRTDAADIDTAYSLLHEIGHATLDHRRYRHDFELLSLEVAAWEQAKLIATKYDITIDEDHLQDCLDSYRDWLYRRSLCPDCHTVALQADGIPRYDCFNCHASWQVSPSRFCRPYRQIKNGSKPDRTAPVAPTFAAVS